MLLASAMFDVTESRLDIIDKLRMAYNVTLDGT
jgi:hypothetical protein